VNWTLAQNGKRNGVGGGEQKNRYFSFAHSLTTTHPQRFALTLASLTDSLAVCVEK